SGLWNVATLVNQGTMQPGLVGAPLDLTGNFVQASGAVLRIAVSPSATAMFNITGSATLNGTLDYVLAPGSYAPATQSFLSATGGVSGAFTTVTQTAAFVPLSFGLLGGVANFQILQNFVVAPQDGVLFSATDQAMTLSADQASDSLLGHAADRGGACQAGVLQVGNSGAAGVAGAVASAFCGAGGWAEATGSALGVAGGYNTRGGGFLAGLDRAVGGAGTRLRLGLAVGYDEAALADKAGGGKAEIGTTRIGLYGAQPLGAFTLSGDLMEGFIATRTTRATSVGGAVGPLAADADRGRR
ncbi:MAG TPA: autotransporter outer membrane beta-barrel domain-containing protein, partial [Acidocella sp.]|nr:autotransporter outer membrane beta-barrel domain-containing protein [Acidocella sp.]